MNDYEVSLLHQGGGRDVLKDGMTMGEADVWARSYIEAHPRMKGDIWITRTPPGEGVKMVKVMYLGGPDSTAA